MKPARQNSRRLASTLFGPTREAVLRLLFARPGQRFYLRQLARIVGTGLGAMQHELHRLEEARIVRRFRDGRRVYYEANSDCPICRELVHLMRRLARTR